MIDGADQGIEFRSLFVQVCSKFTEETLSGSGVLLVMRLCLVNTPRMVGFKLLVTDRTLDTPVSLVFLCVIHNAPFIKENQLVSGAYR